MKKTRFFPFERNRYFYGKLLTVRDFETEQTYFNNKRRMLNRVLFGSGVAAGLQVVAVDDKSVSVQMGVAIDRLGREIVVSSPVTLKLSMIEGFTNNEYGKNVYLCIAYDEKGKEPVHSVTGTATRAEEVNEYNRMQEGYKLFVREEPPDPELFAEKGGLDDVRLLYQDAYVRVLHCMPRYANPDEVVEVSVRIEKTLQTPKTSLRLRWASEAFEPIGPGSSHELQLEESADEASTCSEFKYYMKCTGSAHTRIPYQVVEGVLAIGDREVKLSEGNLHEIEIVDEPIKERQVRDYFHRSLDESIVATPDYIHLAKISLLQMGATYMIDKVEQVPFGEYIYNMSDLYRHGVFTEKNIPDFEEKQPTPVEIVVDDKTLAPLKRKWTEDIREQLLAEIKDTQAASGWIEFELDSTRTGAVKFFKRGDQAYFSEEIVHGLGKGNVHVSVGLEEAEVGLEDAGESSQAAGIYYGNHAVFKQSEFAVGLPKVDVGVIVYPNAGTFRIGLKIQQSTDLPLIRLRWWALRKTPGSNGYDVSGVSGMEAAAGTDSSAGPNT